EGPSILALTRQNLRPVRTAAADENLCARGAYRLKAAENARKVLLIATGSEVEIALGAAEKLEAEGIGVDVVSMPCAERFDAQSAEYRDEILPHGTGEFLLRVSIEAVTTFGWSPARSSSARTAGSSWLASTIWLTRRPTPGCSRATACTANTRAKSRPTAATSSSTANASR